MKTKASGVSSSISIVSDLKSQLDPPKSEETNIETQEEQLELPKPRRQISYLETCMHQFKSGVGPSTFAVGEAFKNSGLLLGPPLLLLIGVITVHSQHILLNCNAEIKRRHAGSLKVLPGYADTVELCFVNGPPKVRRFSALARKLANIFICLSKMGTCCVLFVFLCTNVHGVMQIWGYDMKLSNVMLIVFVPAMMLGWIRHLKLLAPFTSVANLLLVASYIGTMYVLSQDLPPVSQRPYVGDRGTMPLFFGMALYIFDTSAAVIPFKNEMKNPRSYDKPLGLLNIVTFVAACLSVVMGFLSYLKYGDDILPSVTLNLDPKSAVLPQSIKVAMCLSVLMGISLQFYFAASIIWAEIDKTFGSFSRPAVMETIVRSLLYLFILLAAEVIPHLNLFISLSGAVNSASIAFIFPPLIEILLRWDTMHRFRLAKNSCMILLGIGASLTGTFVTVQQIISKFNT